MFDPETEGLIPYDQVEKFSQAVSNIESNVENSDAIVSLDEAKTEEARENQNLELYGAVRFVKEQWHRTEKNREWDEERWLECYRNYRGIYGPDVKFTDTEKSEAFIKVTKTKVLAAYAQILDVLFSNNKFPIGVEPSPVPLGIEEAVHFDQNDQAPPSPEGPRDTSHRELQLDKGLKDKLEKADIAASVQVGPGVTPTAYTWHPAKRAAYKMEKEILDQLEEANATKSLRSMIFEMCLFGEGVYKGPFVVDKEYPKWDEEGTYDPLFKTIPDVGHVSIWDFYPDPDARSIDEATFVIQRHRMSKSDMRALKKRPYFREETIESCILQGYNYQPQDWEFVLVDKEYEESSQRFEVLEYWGSLDSEMAEEAGLKIPDELKEKDEFQVNMWVCDDKIIRLVMNPFTPARIPFYAVPYELNPYSFFGVGVAENMLDTQLIMNGFLRLAVDNAALSGNIIFEVQEEYLVPGQSMKLEPGKVFRRASGPPGQAIFSHKIDNVTQECIMMFDKARQLADEATGMPSYAHGGVGVSGVGKTASGMSMLMGAAAQNIKAVVKNLDDYLLMPLGHALFAFNMQFNFDKDYIGDVSISAKGTESLMRNEVRSQKLMQFVGLSQNPQFAPFVKVQYILSEIAKSLDLDPDKVLNDPREAAIQAQIMGGMAQAQGIQPTGAPGQQPQGPGGMNNALPNPGSAPAQEQTAAGPEEQGFAGNQRSQGAQNLNG